MKSLKDIINNFQHSFDKLLKNQNLKKLKKTGLDKNTVVVFTSDHG